MSHEYQIGCLWIEGPLSFMEQLCLKSFVDAGHHTILYHYGDVPNVPEGVEKRDAREVMDHPHTLTHTRTGSPAIHADRFRYLMLAQIDRIIWADTDAYCLKPFETANGHFYGREGPQTVANGVLALPQDSDTLRGVIEFTADEYAVPPWLPRQVQDEYRAAADRGEPVHVGDMTWGAWGPQAITHFLHKTGEFKHALDPHVLYPFPYRHRGKLVRRDVALADFVREDTVSIHFFGRRMRARLASMDNRVPGKSPFGRLLRKHGINPADAPVIQKKVEAA
jgi:hypothetical protein